MREPPVNAVGLLPAFYQKAFLIPNSRYLTEFPNAHFVLVGHSHGGFIALRSASEFARNHPAGTIKAVITLDSPLHGYGDGAAAFFSSTPIFSTLGGLVGFDCGLPIVQDLNALAAMDSGQLAENDVAIIAHFGGKVYTFGNLDDCLYEIHDCAVEKHAPYAPLAPDSVESTQFVSGAVIHVYQLGHAGGNALTDGHGAILSDPGALNDITQAIHAATA